MTNTNCLENIKCPACGNEALFRIAAKTMATVTDDGVEDHTEMEWDDDSYAECLECFRQGTMKDFQNSAQTEPYFAGATGTRYTYAEIADRIRRDAPHTLGKHISEQLEALGLLDELMNGTTPCGLPFTFADAAGTASPPSAPKLLAALQMASHYLADDLDEGDETEMRVFGAIRSAIDAANAAGIRPEPNAPKLLASLEAILPYAESEAYSLEKLKDSPQAEAEAERAWKAVEVAQAIVAQAKAAGIVPAPADLDIDAYLAKRRQIAAIWSIEDVKGVRPHLSEEQAWDVLQQVKDVHDAEWGISWTTLETVADDLFPEPKAEEA